MHKRVLKSMVLTSFAVLVAIPAFAQVRADVGPLHIRIATDAPPPVRYEVRTVRPDHTAVWTNGYWDRQGDQWAWSSGRWQQPVAPRARWVKAWYKREGCPWYRRQMLVALRARALVEPAARGRRGLSGLPEGTPFPPQSA